MQRGALFFSVLALLSCGCEKEKIKGDLPPPPPSTAPGASGSAGGTSACASGGGELTDPVSAPYFVKKSAGYCLDPQGEIETFGEKGKLSMDQVCTQAWDGGCEQYKALGLTRAVRLHYVDGAGKGGNVEVVLTKFKDDAGAYAMFTDRVVTNEHDAADPSTPRPLDAGGAGAIGTGRAYVWRGPHLLELQYNNENESPDQLAKSSLAVLTTLGKELGEKLPGPKTLPPSAQALPKEHLVPNGILFKPKDAFVWKGVGPLAMGFYKDGDKRWRVLSIVKDDADQAKDAFKTIKSTPGTLPIANVGDEAAHVVVPTGEKGSGPKVEMLVARKGNQIWAISDEEYALREASDPAKARVSKEDATAWIKPLLASPSAAPDAGAAPKK